MMSQLRQYKFIFTEYVRLKKYIKREYYNQCLCDL